jgi:hypothetical protein
MEKLARTENLRISTNNGHLWNGISSIPGDRCLQQLANEEGQHFLRAAEVLKRDFYVDDCLSGCATLQEAQQMQQQLSELLKLTGFPSRKWSSNSSEFLVATSEELRETQYPLQFDKVENARALGLLWHPALDQFQVASGITPSAVKGYMDTKRKVLAIIASIFDPLGLVTPVVMAYKIFMQTLWQVKSQWDEKLPQPLQIQLENIYHQLAAKNDIRINRLGSDAMNIEIRGFCDRS